MIVGTTEAVKSSLNTLSFVPIFGPNHQCQEHRKRPSLCGISKIHLSGEKRNGAIAGGDCGLKEVLS